MAFFKKSPTMMVTMRFGKGVTGKQGFYGEIVRPGMDFYVKCKKLQPLFNTVATSLLSWISSVNNLNKYHLQATMMMNWIFSLVVLISTTPFMYCTVTFSFLKNLSTIGKKQTMQIFPSLHCFHCIILFFFAQFFTAFSLGVLINPSITLPSSKRQIFPGCWSTSWFASILSVLPQKHLS